MSAPYVLSRSRPHPARPIVALLHPHQTHGRLIASSFKTCGVGLRWEQLPWWVGLFASTVLVYSLAIFDTFNRLRTSNIVSYWNMERQHKECREHEASCHLLFQLVILHLVFTPGHKPAHVHRIATRPACFPAHPPPCRVHRLSIYCMQLCSPPDPFGRLRLCHCKSAP